MLEMLQKAPLRAGVFRWIVTVSGHQPNGSQLAFKKGITKKSQSIMCNKYYFVELFI